MLSAFRLGSLGPAAPRLGGQAKRARVEEDARELVYPAEQEAALMTARRRRAIAALDEK